MSLSTETYLVQKRQFYGKGGALALGLSAKEDAAGIPSAVAMQRIRAGTLRDPEWAQMYAEYRRLIRQPAASSPPKRTEVAAVPVDEKVVKERRAQALARREEPLDD